MTTRRNYDRRSYNRRPTPFGYWAALIILAVVLVYGDVSIVIK